MGVGFPGSHFESGIHYFGGHFGAFLTDLLLFFFSQRPAEYRVLRLNRSSLESPT